jgi:beta-glucosidase
LHISVEVTNSGDREGDEVAQLYVRQDTSSVEVKTLNFAVPQSELAIWNVDGKWMTEPGTFTLWVGGNSRAELTTKFTLTP